MRTLRLALVLLALAVFIGATIAAADAATTPTATSTPVKKTMATPKKIPTPTKMPAPKMMGGLEKFSQANEAAGNTVKLEAAMMTKSIQKEVAQNSGKMSSKLAIPGMGGLRQMPAMGTLNMPDWTAPGIILTI